MSRVTGRVRAVAGALGAAVDQVPGHGLEVGGQTQPVAGVDDGRRVVEGVVAQFGRAVVAGEGMVVVVPALAQRRQRHHPIVGRIDVPVPVETKSCVETREPKATNAASTHLS